MFPKRLAEMRNKRCLSQKTFAELISMSQQAVAKWEIGGSSPSPQQLHDICFILNVSADYLIGLTDKPESISSNQAKDEKDNPVVHQPLSEDMQAAILALIRSELDKQNKDY